MKKILEISGLSIDYVGASPKRLVDGLDFCLERGKTIAIVGESGAGKSMTSLAVMDLLPEGVTRSGGCIKVDGCDISSLNAEGMRALRGDKLAMIMQNPMSAFDPVFTIRSHFAETLQAHQGNLGKARIAEKAREALASAAFENPDEILDVYPFQMSGGMLQRVMIALALICDPLLLIADEATTDLDVVTQKQIVELLRQRRERLGLSLMLITHDLSVAAALADDVLVMHQGRPVEKAAAAQIFANPAEAYTKELLQAHYNLYEGQFEAFMQHAKGDANVSA